MLDRDLFPFGRMSIETLLTLGLTAVILGAAIVLKLIVLGSLKLGLLLAGKDPSWLKPQRAAPSQTRTRPKAAGRSRRPAADLVPAFRRALVSAGRTATAAIAALGAALAAAATSAGTAAVAGAAALEDWADRTNRRLAPRTMEATAALRQRTSAAAKRIAPLLVTVIATVQHLVSAAASWIRERVSATGTPPERAPEPKRVIDLDRDDPLGTPGKRPTAGVRL